MIKFAGPRKCAREAGEDRRSDATRDDDGQRSRLSGGGRRNRGRNRL